MVPDTIAPIPNPVARIANSFLLHARYDFTANQQLILSYLVTGVNPFADKLYQVDVPVKNFKKLLKVDASKKWGSFGERLDAILSDMLGKKVRFPSGVVYDGFELPNEVVWIQSRKAFIDPVTKEAFIRFKFGEDMVPFLIGLKKYAQIHVVEVRPMTSRFAVRLFFALKAKREEERKYKRITNVRFELKELKALLGAQNKYQGKFKDFNRYVIQKSVDQINEFTSLKVMEVQQERKGRSVHALTFVIIDQKPKHNPELHLPEAPESQLSLFDMAPDEKDTNVLTYAQYLAYIKLVDHGIYEGIAFRRILPKIKGSEVEGFEDKFVQYALEHIQNKARQMNPAIIADWWINKKTFEPNAEFGDVWAKIMEQVIAYKKIQAEKEPEGYKNRQIAREMTWIEFCDRTGISEPQKSNT